MNYTELICNTFDYSEASSINNDTVLKFRVQLVGTGADEYSNLNITQIDQLLNNWDGRKLTWDNVMEVGDLLGNALFQPKIREVLLLNMPKKGSDDRLRIRLLLNYPLTNYPFEYLLINDAGGEITANNFLALHPNISIVRQQDIKTQPGRLSQAKHPVKLVVALANPTNDLDLSKERVAIENALNQYPEHVELVFCEQAGRVDLIKGLVEAPIFHYAGHAVMDKKASEIFGLLDGKGKLILQDGDLRVEELSLLLKKANTSLAVLSGCDTAMRDDLNVWSSLAAHLLNAGLFAVIAMQFKIGNESAIAFASEFYKALFAGLPIAQAVINGRLNVASQGNVRDWAVPVLYLAGTTDGIVFEGLKNDPSLESLRDQIRSNAINTINNFTRTLIEIKAQNISWGTARKVVIINNWGTSPDEIKMIVDTFYEKMPRLNPKELDKTLNQFREYIRTLKEWKELHYYLDGALSSFNPYDNVIQRIMRIGRIDHNDILDIRYNWGSLSCSIDDLIRFARAIKIIGEPLKDIAGDFTGPDWAVDIYKLREYIAKILDSCLDLSSPNYLLQPRQKTMPIAWDTLVGHTINLHNKILHHMSDTDKHLLETAGDLSNLSDNVFGSLQK